MSASFNMVVLMGNLTRDPEIKYTPKGTAVAEVGLAVNRVWYDQDGRKNEEVTFVDVTLWGRQAEIAGEYLQKGSPAHIQGYLKLDQWEDKQTGQNRSKLRVVAESLQLIGSPRDDQARTDRARDGRREAQGRNDRQQAPKPTARAPRPPADPDLDVGDDDIPF